jgi:branched-chain amino acid transport system ATP-binding protein
VQALEDVDLELGRQEVVGLIGPNGAGKTTLVNLITGFDFPTAGRIELEQREITRWPPQRRGRAGLARTFQHGHAFRGLSVRENVEVAALGVGASARDARRRATALLDALGRRRRCRTATSASSVSRARLRPSLATC